MQLYIHHTVVPSRKYISGTGSKALTPGKKKKSHLICQISELRLLIANIQM